MKRLNKPSASNEVFLMMSFSNDPFARLHYLASAVLLLKIAMPVHWLPVTIANLNSVELYGFAVLFFSVSDGSVRMLECLIGRANKIREKWEAKN